jgi:transcriptional regulator with XRE-family HTH domain
MPKFHSLPLGRRIKARRLLCWMSQEEFATRVGVSRRQVVYWEADTDAPSAVPDRDDTGGVPAQADVLRAKVEERLGLVDSSSFLLSQIFTSNGGDIHCGTNAVRSGPVKKEWSK